MNEITLAVATYNRADYLEKLSASLKESVDLERIHLRIYDDCSTELSVEDIRRIVPYATSVVRRASNLRADGNMYQIFQDFLSTEDEYLLLCDSDLIFRPGWLDVLLEQMPRTDGILSLYNSRMHPFLPIDTSDAQAVFASKEDLGAAGCAFTRRRVEDIVRAFPVLPTYTTFDWIWSEYFRQQGLRLCCLRESYIQHIGVIGQNNFGQLTRYDYGLDFLPVSAANQRIMVEFVDGLVSAQQGWEEQHGLSTVLLCVAYDRRLAQRGVSPWNRGERVSWLHYTLVCMRRLLLWGLQKLSF